MAPRKRDSDDMAIQAVEACIGSSMLAACKRLAGSCAAANASTEEKLTAAARGVEALFEEVQSTYAPELGAEVINAQSLAAWHLHTLMAPQIQAYFSSGNASAAASGTALALVLCNAAAP